MKLYDVVRWQTWMLPAEVRTNIPCFTSFNDLILSSQAGGMRCLAIDTAVRCIYELVIFMRQGENSPADLLLATKTEGLTHSFIKTAKQTPGITDGDKLSHSASASGIYLLLPYALAVTHWILSIDP